MYAGIKSYVSYHNRPKKISVMKQVRRLQNAHVQPDTLGYQGHVATDRLVRMEDPLVQKPEHDHSTPVAPDPFAMTLRLEAIFRSDNSRVNGACWRSLARLNIRKRKS